MNPDRDLARLIDRFAEVEHVVRWPDERLYLRLEHVSAWSPAQHVDHVVRALGIILDAVDRLRDGTSTDIELGGVPNLAGFAVLTTGWIPRGRGDAPPAALPEPSPVRHRLRESVYEVAQRTRRLEPHAAGLRATVGTLPHPVLGPMRAAHWLRFADVHTRHHLAIVADLDRRRAVGALTPLLGDEGGWSAEAP